MDNSECINSKAIKKYILDVSNDLDDIIEYLDIDYKNTIEGIFNAIFTLMRHYEQNKSRIDYLIWMVEGSISLKPSIELKYLTGPIIDLQNKINDNFKLKNKIIVREPMLRIQEILFKVDKELATSVHNEKIKYLSFLIFEERNINLIDNFINENKGILSSKNKDGDNIFTILLKRYIYLDENKYDDIEYFYHIIMLFINSKYNKEILKLSSSYMDIIKKSKLAYKEHIIRVIELFNPNFSISLEKLEERYGVSFEFLPSIKEEINRFKMDNDGRINFLNQECFTIDGNGTTCYDDALYLEKNIDGTYYLYIHITDIPSFVPFNSITDMEARNRGETLYLRDRKISLYPEEISDGICSLIKDNHRNVITYIFHLDTNYEIIPEDFNFVKGKIQVRHQLSYEDADKIIMEENTSLADMLRKNALYADVRKRGNSVRQKYRDYQNALDFNPNHESLKSNESPSANIIHESMILVNYRIGKYCKDLGIPYLYRKYDIPSEAFIQEQLMKLKDVNLDYLHNKEIYQRIKDSYTSAVYTDIPTYHRGQNLECYTHSSSSARRYADSFNQYLIYDIIFNKNQEDANIYKWQYLVNDLANYLNKKKKENEVFSNHYNYLSAKSLIRKK